MSASSVELIRAFDGLGVSNQAAFTQLIQGGRLRFSGASNDRCDLIDDLSARLICECISAHTPILIVWPDRADWRAPLAFAAAVVCDSVLHLESDSYHGRVLYVGADSAIKEQFASVKVGSMALQGVFAQEYSRGGAKLRKAGPESTLPVVTTIASPAQPDRIVSALQPRWIAVDCGAGATPAWLTELLASAKAHQIPVIGWTSKHLSGVVEQWRAQGGCVFQWPKRPGAAQRIDRFDLFDEQRQVTRIEPLVLSGAGPGAVSDHLAQAYLRLSRHARKSLGQLPRDALSVAWRYLRLLENIPVPFVYYEAECSKYWGMPPIERIRGTLERFVSALVGQGSLHSDLASATDRLEAAEALLRNEADPPVWIAAVNIAIEATQPTKLVFNNRAHRDMFRFALLSRYNISEEDLASLEVSLLALSDFDRAEDDATPSRIVLCGMPSKSAEWRFEALLEAPEIGVVVWPHLESAMKRRANDWERKLCGSYSGDSPLNFQPGNVLDGNQLLLVTESQSIPVAEMQSAACASGPMGLECLWKQPEAADAIKALFDIENEEDIANEDRAKPSDAERGFDTIESEWVEEALKVEFEDGSAILLPLDDQVNTISRSLDGIRVESRFSRSLRVGDEILLVHGDHRRGIYDLLVSRVHSHPKIAPWLMLVDRWHQDLRSAFSAEQRRSGMTFENALHAMQRRGSEITSPAAVRAWIFGLTLAPSDWQDIKRLGDQFNIEVAKQFAREIGNAASRLAGLHRSLSNRLNRWLESEEAGAAVLSGSHSVVDAELGLTIDDFKHSIVRGRIARLARLSGPFLRAHLGQLERSAA